MAEPYSVDPLRALPAAAYRPDSHAVDLERIWRASWVFVGTSDEVATPGDFVATEVGGQPLIVLRDQQGELAALSNMCAHRGTPLVEGHGNASTFSCPYHAWTYADDGRLLGVPYASRDVDRSTHCLPRYRAEEWHGLVFATMDDGAAPLRERFAHIDRLVRDAGLDSLHHWTSHRGDEIWEANWKLVVSNAMESYHVFRVHPDTLEPDTPTAGAHYVVGNADATATGGSASSGEPDDDYLLVSLPPNFVGVLTGDGLYWQAVQPLAHDRTRVVTGGASPHRPPEQLSGLSRWVTQAVTGFGDRPADFLPEDRAICERVQRAAGGDYEPGVLVPMEQVLVDFHHFLARQLHGADVPPVRAG